MFYVCIYTHTEEGRKRLKNLPRDENQLNGDYDYLGEENMTRDFSEFRSCFQISNISFVK